MYFLPHTNGGGFGLESGPERQSPIRTLSMVTTCYHFLRVNQATCCGHSVISPAQRTPTPSTLPSNVRPGFDLEVCKSSPQTPPLHKHLRGNTLPRHIIPSASGLPQAWSLHSCPWESRGHCTAPCTFFQTAFTIKDCPVSDTRRRSILRSLYPRVTPVATRCSQSP